MTTIDQVSPPILEAKGIGKYFHVGGGFRPKRLRALHEVSFALGARQVVALVGESGSGKSTIARLLVVTPGRELTPFPYGACRDSPLLPWRAYERAGPAGKARLR